MSGEEVSRAPVEARSTPATSSAGKLTTRSTWHAYLADLQADLLGGPPLAVIPDLQLVVETYAALPRIWRGARALRQCAGTLLISLRGPGRGIGTKEDVIAAIERLVTWEQSQTMSDQVFFGNLVYYTLQCVAVRCKHAAFQYHHAALIKAMEWAHQALAAVQFDRDSLSEEEMFLLFVQHSPFVRGR